MKRYSLDFTKITKSANKLIPGVSQLLGKRPDMYLKDNSWPTYYKKAKGVNIWGIDGTKYYDFSMMSAGTSVLGYADNDVNKTAIKVIKSGSISTLNPPEDVELAKLLIKDNPWAENVKFARTGGESMAIAVRLARAYTGRDKILFCGYHGWHDWYLAANFKSKKNLNFHLLPGLKTLGVPKGLKGTIIPFRFNNSEDLEKIVRKNAKNCAAIIMEPCREELPDKKYILKIRKIANKYKCVLIFDEITSGWRLNSGGAYKILKVNPDLVVYGKTIANGIPMSAILGKKKIMSQALKTFISSVFWTEKLGPACALTFIKKYKKLKVSKKLIYVGKRVKKIWKKAAMLNNLKIEISGIDPLASFKIITDNWPATITYFIQEMLKLKILASDKCYANYKHDEKSLKIYEKACNLVFNKISLIHKKGTILKELDGPIKEMGFNRLTKK
jgi:glutamate-1-semialdehyde 2,1-aminomutase